MTEEGRGLAIAEIMDRQITTIEDEGFHHTIIKNPGAII